MDDITRRYAEHVNNRGNKMFSHAMQMIMAQTFLPEYRFLVLSFYFRGEFTRFANNQYIIYTC